VTLELKRETVDGGGACVGVTPLSKPAIRPEQFQGTGAARFDEAKAEFVG
jgi:hypothetical protein